MRVLLTFAAAFAAAILGTLLGLPRAAWLWLGGLGVLAGLLLLPVKRGRRLTVILLGLAAGLCWRAGYQCLVVDPAEALAGRNGTITAVALDYSADTAWGQRVPARLTLEGRTVKAQVWLNMETALSPGDTFTVRAELESALSDSYYPAEGYFLLAYGDGPMEITPCAQTPLGLWPRVIAGKLEDSLRQAMPEDVLGFALALTTGDRSALSVSVQSDLKTAGIFHALALSGMHLTTLIGTLGLLIRRKRRLSLVGIPVCILFTLVTGARPSLVRACVMQCILLLAPLAGREEDTPTSLGAAALVLLVQNPWCILGWGTQLSFTSMAGIVLLGERFYRTLKPIYKNTPRNSLRRKLARGACASLATTLSATVFTVPLMMAYFGMLSLVGPVTNLLTGWAITWCFRGGLLTAVLGCFLPGPAKVMGWLLAWGYRYVAWAAETLARLPFAALYTRTVYAVLWVALCYGMFLLLARTPRDQRRYPIPLCCLVLGLTACIGFTLLEDDGPVVTVLDVGQGQCILARDGESTLMIDCGGSGGAKAGSLAAEYLDSLGENRVDLLLLTHYDTDHIGGVETLLGQVTVGKVLMPDYEPENGEREVLAAAAQSAGTEVLVLEEDASARVGQWQLTVYAGQGDREGKDQGLAVLLQAGDMSLLITGDMDAEGEWRLLRTHDLPQVDVLVAGHHGAKSSTSEPLLELLQPKAVAISVGKNSYGHPAEETLERITSRGADIFRTDLQGTLRIKGA